MQNHWKSTYSQHKVPLSSLTKDFILQRRSLLNEDLQIQIYQNEVHIKDHSLIGDEIWRAPQDEVFKGIFDELTKKVKLYKIKGFHKLSLSFNSCEEMGRTSFQYLKKVIIQNFVGLKSLVLNFSKRWHNLSKDMIEIIADFISNFKGLESLQILLVGFTETSDPSMKLLLKRIHANLRHLKNLHIDVSARLDWENLQNELPRADLFERLTSVGHNAAHSHAPSQLSEKGVLQANHLITKYLYNLQELNLNFSDSEKHITDRVCQELGQRILEKMERLKRLTLSFWKCNALTNEAMRLFSGTKKSRATALEHLTLELAQVWTDDIGLELLEEGICTQFKNLKGLVLNLMDCRITSEGLEGFNKSIVQNLQSLQALTLAGIWSRAICGEGVKSISKDICKNVKNLKELVLMFSEIDDVWPAISSDIEENSVNLEKLSLMLPSSYYGPFDLTKFTYVLTTTLKDLIELNLDFYDPKKVNNEVIMELGKALEGLAKLKRLALIINACLGIGGEEEKSQKGKADKKATSLKLGALVPRTATLEKFEAHFRWCSLLRDEHVNEFGSSLCKFQKGLRVLNVDFARCELLTDASFKEFCRGVKHDMKNLEDLTLNFFNCEKISGDVKSEMKMLFREVPLVNLC